VLDEEGVDAERDPFATARELRPLADVVLLLRGDPERCSDFYAREVAALLPRPLPGSDALVRAHLRWLASCRRARTRELLLGNAINTHRDALEANEPALASALTAALGDRKRQPSIMAMGDAELAKIVGGVVVSASPDVVVVGVAAEDRMDTRLREARNRAAGAAVIVVRCNPNLRTIGSSGLRRCARLSRSRTYRRDRSHRGQHREPSPRRGDGAPVGGDAGALRSHGPGGARGLDPGGTARRGRQADSRRLGRRGRGCGAVGSRSPGGGR